MTAVPLHLEFARLRLGELSVLVVEEIVLWIISCRGHCAP